MSLKNWVDKLVSEKFQSEEEKSKELEKQNELIEQVCNSMRDMLIKKNYSYGGNVFEPLKLKEGMTNIDMIDVRISDKLNRLIKGEEYEQEDTLNDLAGYILLREAVKRYNRNK
mgnify:CR=1 FL=1